MDEKLLQERITRAVDSHCAHLRTNPDLAQRVIREAKRKEPVTVKRKMSFGLVLAIVLMLLTTTAVAAVLLSGMELIEQEAVPLAQSNDSTTRPLEEYSPEELNALILTAAENGIILDDDTSIMRAFRSGEGYSEEETIMAICREAFGGLFYDWTVEQKHWFQEMMIAIGWATENTYDLPGEEDMPSEEARALAVKLLRENYGADIPLDDPTMYRDEEWYYDGGDDQQGLNWNFTFRPLYLEGGTYYIGFDNQGGSVWHRAETWNHEGYTEEALENRIDSVYNYRYGGSGMSAWEYDAWYVFGQWLPGATRTEEWDEAWDGYLASTYLLPGETDLTRQQAREIAFKDAGCTDYTGVTELLLGKGDQRIWKITFTTQVSGKKQVLSYEIDSVTRIILHKYDYTADVMEWARYMLHETYESVATELLLTQGQAIELAIAALEEKLGSENVPFLDENYFELRAGYSEWAKRYDIMFWTKVLEYPVCGVYVNDDGTTEVWRSGELGVNADNLFQRFSEVYGAVMDWTQARWVEFSTMQKELAAQSAPTTFEGKLFAATNYPSDAGVKITRDEAMDIVYLDSGKSEINRIVLIQADPNPIWKVRASTWPVTTMYEVDAMTGDILDKEPYFIQMPNFDDDMMMYTLRRDYKPAALKEFGVERLAMELCVKANAEDYYDISADWLMSGAYRISTEGMTVSFMAVDPRSASYIVTVAEDAMSAEIEVVPGVEGVELLSDEEKAEVYAQYRDNGRLTQLEAGTEIQYDSVNTDEIFGSMTLEEAQAHAFQLLLKAVGKDAVEAFDQFAVGYSFDSITRFEGDEEQPRWRFYFVDADNPSMGWKVTFAIWDGVPESEGDVKDVNDLGNG